MDKQEALARWIKIEPDQPVMPHFTPIAADAHGSTFGACGIRISGNPAFIDAVLSRLKDLLEAESGTTRLVLSRQPVKPVSIQKGDGKAVDKQWANAADDAEVCYVQIRERSGHTRHRKAMERTSELPKSDREAAMHVKPEPRTGDLFAAAEAKSAKSKAKGKTRAVQNPAPDPEPMKVAHIGSRNGEVLWGDEDGEEP